MLHEVVQFAQDQVPGGPWSVWSIIGGVFILFGVAFRGTLAQNADLFERAFTAVDTASKAVAVLADNNAHMVHQEARQAKIEESVGRLVARDDAWEARVRADERARAWAEWQTLQNGGHR